MKAMIIRKSYLEEFDEILVVAGAEVQRVHND
jgi:hypothetical protein